jgi:PAS domain S-box-containing protein
MIADIFESGQGQVLEKKDFLQGREYYIRTEAYPIKEKGVVQAIALFSKDVSQYVRQQKEKEELLRLNLSFTNSLGEIMYDFQVSENTVDWKGALTENIGFSQKELGTDFDEWKQRIHPDDFEIFRVKHQKAVERKENLFSCEFRFKAKSSEYIWIQDSSTFFYNEEGELERCIGIFLNVTDRKKLEVERIKDIVMSVDIERERIARELHDSLGQTLTAATLNLASIKKEISEISENGKDNFNLAQQLVVQAVEDGRTISHDLMPKALDDYGLVASVDNLINRMNSVSSLEFTFYCNTPDKRFEKDLEIHLYRITQEAINNVIIHAEAKSIIIQLINHKNYLIYTVEDDGKGFDPYIADKSRWGIGLKNIENRAKLIEGDFYIDSTKNRGTVLTIEVSTNQPLENDQVTTRR